MAKKAYIGNNSNIARKAKKAYIGNNSNVARKIKKAYIGDSNNKARLFWSYGETVAYYKKLTDLSAARGASAGASTGNYFIATGGTSSTTNAWPDVETYNTSFTKGTATSLSESKYDMASASFNNLAIFAGGYIPSKQDRSSLLEVFDSSLVKTNPSRLDGGTGKPASVVLNDFLLIGGGSYYSTTNGNSSVNLFDKSLTRIKVGYLTTKRRLLAGGSINGYALFAGGMSSDTIDTILNTVEAFDSSLTKNTNVSTLSIALTRLAGASMSTYVLFGGGTRPHSSNQSSYPTDDMDAFNTSLTRSFAPYLTVAANSISTVTLNNNALFAGGDRWSSEDQMNNVDCYNSSLTKTVLNALSGPNERYNIATGVLGDYAIFAGGFGESAVDVYTLG